MAKEPEKKLNDEKMAEGKEEPEEAASESQGVAELREQLLRLAAEFDNYKKRVKKEIESAQNAGKAALFIDMLPIIDEFELAMLAISSSKGTPLTKGIEMLYSNFTDVLKKEGLKEIEVDGIFDPYRHETVLVRESDEKDGTILETVKKGYTFEGILLRPASVIISKKSAKSDKKAEGEAEAKEKK
ncbi:MAG: nucleotide exchange factor GrpE [Candidatus Micrarchaeaceae archaeon]|nr:nucleotide exchange factor GrpE [Candidatus Micrarchaeota archaeon]HII09895.1 nucleotide exchange factor GrpE [Candidatus Micrarchaeota archaeon]